MDLGWEGRGTGHTPAGNGRCQPRGVGSVTPMRRPVSSTQMLGACLGNSLWKHALTGTSKKVSLPGGKRVGPRLLCPPCTKPSSLGSRGSAWPSLHAHVVQNPMCTHILIFTSMHAGRLDTHRTPGRCRHLLSAWAWARLSSNRRVRATAFR